MLVYFLDQIVYKITMVLTSFFFFFFFQAEDGIRDVERSRGLGDVYKRQALIPALAKSWAEVPPELLSFIPFVKGLFPPAESLPVFAAVVPDNNPGAKTSLLFFPRGWHKGSTSDATTAEVSPLPPSELRFSGTSSIHAFKVERSALQILSFIKKPPFLQLSISYKNIQTLKDFHFCRIKFIQQFQQI
eukprot:TRINITY_DN67123_c0_g1_i1.p1 TRINITY_DN67123_c0_g1~~TRINITY_DN67123_c0_g1_i1.p1  ORF type:complete len:188 (-),score=35.16 TRINITY_DN67123_c0_g1_i1:71-634(-)